MLTLSQRIAKMLPDRGKPRALPLLEPDPAPAFLRPRRRHDCADLLTCEEDWIRMRGASQARCPKNCKAFRSRA